MGLKHTRPEACPETLPGRPMQKGADATGAVRGDFWKKGVERDWSKPEPGGRVEHSPESSTPADSQNQEKMRFKTN